MKRNKHKRLDFKDPYVLSKLTCSTETRIDNKNKYEKET